ncbi:DUF2442 domain-containing protein [Microbacterium sp.]|uniref:DUF2442 domain-containing protein n=1 Tax=Microbacterium sp. TaxID=51671 RepID=UPI003F986F36
MSTSIDDVCVVDVHVDHETVHVKVSDGRTISAPLSWFPRLASASVGERADWRLIGAGEGIHWQQIDEDISLSALLRGR